MICSADQWGRFYVMVTLAWIGKIDEWLSWISVFRYFLFFLVKKKEHQTLTWYRRANCFSSKNDAKFLLLGTEKIMTSWCGILSTHKLFYEIKTANLRNNSLLVRTIFVTCMIPCRRLAVPNLIFIGTVSGKSWGKKSCFESFFNSRGDKWRVYLLVKLHCEVCLTTCINKIKVLIDKPFFRYFKENIDTQLKAH